MDDAILLVLSIWLSPAIFAGVFFLGKIVRGYFMVRMKGCIKANFVGRNHIIRSYFVKPVGPQIKVGDRTFNYNDSTGYVIRDGSTPTVFYNEKTCEQIDMTRAESKMPLDPNHFSDLLIRAYNLGVIKSQKDDEKVKQYVLFTLIGVVISIVVSIAIVITVISFSGSAMPMLESIKQLVSTTVLG
jgi:hypothetical protein